MVLARTADALLARGSLTESTIADAAGAVFLQLAFEVLS